jgi:hypothetical protein
LNNDDNQPSTIKFVTIKEVNYEIGGFRFYDILYAFDGFLLINFNNESCMHLFDIEDGGFSILKKKKAIHYCSYSYP